MLPASNPATRLALVRKPRARRHRYSRCGALNAIDGTPVLDVKPVMREFLPREPVRQPHWSTELMRDYWTVKE